MPKKGEPKLTYYGLDYYIAKSLGRIPLQSTDVYRKVVDEYGYIEMRTFYRHLKSMTKKRRIVAVEVETFGDSNKFNNYQPANGYYLRNKEGTKVPVFQRQYIDILNKRVEMIQCL